MLIKINGQALEVKKGETILNAAKRLSIRIPTLCHLEALPGQASCRVCIVEIIERGQKKIVASCIYPLTQEAEIFTDTPPIRQMRRTLLRLLLARTPHAALIRELAAEYGVLSDERMDSGKDELCILCGLCVKACKELGANAISAVQRGAAKKIATPYDEASADCIGCGSCAFVCPTDAIRIEDEQTPQSATRTIWNKKFTLLPCEACGQPFITPEQLEHLRKKELLPAGAKLLCPACRKKTITGNLAGIFTNSAVR